MQLQSEAMRTSGSSGKLLTGAKAENEVEEAEAEGEEEADAPGEVQAAREEAGKAQLRRESRLRVAAEEAVTEVEIETEVNGVTEAETEVGIEETEVGTEVETADLGAVDCITSAPLST